MARLQEEINRLKTEGGLDESSEEQVSTTALQPAKITAGKS